EKLANDKNCPGKLVAHRALALLDPEAMRKKFPSDPDLVGLWEITFPASEAQHLGKSKFYVDIRTPGLLCFRFSLVDATHSFENWCPLKTSSDLKPKKYRLTFSHPTEQGATFDLPGLYKRDGESLVVLVANDMPVFSWGTAQQEFKVPTIELPETFPAEDK